MQIQKVNQKMMERFDEICQTYQIEYFLDAGVLLGVVRHGGFIPWDDDVDVVLTRENWEKLRQVPAGEWKEEYELVPCDAISESGFLDFYHRCICLEESIPVGTFDKLQGQCKERYREKISLDIMILDYAHRSIVRQKLLCFRLYMIYAQAMGHRPEIDYNEYTAIQSLFIRMMAWVGKKRKLKKLFERYDCLCQSVKKDEGYYFHSNGLLKNLNFIYPASWYESAEKRELNGRKYPVPVGTDGVLKTLYGDYHKLPPESERCPQHMRG